MTALKAMEHGAAPACDLSDDPTSTLLTLPGGYRDAAGNLHRDVALAPLTGREEELLAGSLSPTPLAVLVSRLLTACLRRLGSLRPVTLDAVRGLLAADREFLLLRLYQLTFGDRITSVLICPACRQPMDVEFLASEVPIESRHPAAATETFEVSPAAAYTAPDGSVHRTVEFRLPTGDDQEIIARAEPALSEEAALTVLLARCVIRLGAISPVDEATAGRLNPLARGEIEERMERVSPSSSLDLQVTCPECGHAFLQPHDWGVALCHAARTRQGQLYREVHRLASHYHWPESEILGLTRVKRHTYLALLGGEADRDVALAVR